VNVRRRIFVALREAGRPLTTADLSRACDAHMPTVANECSRMELLGIVDRPDGPRRGYRLLVDMLPEDAATIAEMVDAYGSVHVRKAARYTS
jgi:DNA-binding IclR family transcriptional regulator